MAAYNFYPQAYGAPYIPSIYPPQFPQPAIPQAPAPAATAQTSNAQQAGILWVSSEAEARNYPVAPNYAVALWDSSRPAVYIKQADASGKPVLKAYDLTERSEASNSAPREETGPETATAEAKREIRKLWAAVEEIQARLETGKRATRKKEVDQDDAE